jgi:PST family polysaccharide transporter
MISFKFLKKTSNRTQNSDLFFRVDHIKNDLKGKTVRGGAITIISQFMKLFLSMCSTIILARLLSPQDFGMIAMVTAITGFAIMFKDMGLSMATIQKANIDNEEISTLFWMNLIFSIFVFLLTVCFSPVIAWYYKEPKIVWITISISIGFILGGLSVQHQALLRRQMRFASLATIEITAQILGIIIGVVFALNGYKYWSLVAMQLTSAFTIAIGTWLFCPWYPARIFCIKKVGSMLAFGGNLTGFNIINYFARNLDNILIGRFFGAQQLGLYSKAYGLLLLPITQINAPFTAVAVPALSRLSDSPERYRRTYLRILEKITILTMPGVVLMIATSDWLVLLVLGPQWTAASSIFSVLGMVALIQPIANTTGWLFITQDRTWQQVQWGFIGGTLSIVSIIAGLPWGVMGVAASYSISGLFIRAPLLIWFVCQTGPIRAIDFYRTSTPAAFASLFVAALLVLFRNWVEISSPLVGLILALFITLLSTLLVLGVLPAGRIALRDGKSLFDSFFKKSASSTQI